MKIVNAAIAKAKNQKNWFSIFFASSFDLPNLHPKSLPTNSSNPVIVCSIVSKSAKDKPNN